MKTKTLIKSVLIFIIACSVAYAGEFRTKTLVARGPTTLAARQAFSDSVRILTDGSINIISSTMRQDGNGVWIYEVQFRYYDKR